MAEKLVETLTWTGCYADSWKGFISSKSFAHPAKFARGLVQCILSVGLERGFWKAGDLLGDPFGGVATGGLMAAYAGLHWMGVELEPKFVEMARENIEEHRFRLEKLGCPLPVIVQGDSRNFAALVHQAVGVVTSPPYVSGGHHADQTGAWNKNGGGQQCSSHARSKEEANYGQTPGQIGRLREGELEGVVTSPPYEKAQTGGGIAVKGNHRVQGVTGTGGYQIAHQGDSSGQIGVTAGETYWQAMYAVYEQMWLALRPGGVACVVVKDYIRDGERVRLVDQTCRLLEAVGFKVFLRVNALLIEKTQEDGLFGEPVVITKSRKSFFRRLHEKKRPDLKIDEEGAIFCRRVNTAEALP